MAFHWCENVHTTAFTPRDYQVELVAAAYEENTIICLGHKSSKEFIALKLLQELSREARKAHKISLYLTCNNNSPSISTMLDHLTDLKVFQQINDKENVNIFSADYQVFLVHPALCIAALKSGTLHLENINLLIVEDCHIVNVYTEILPIFSNIIHENNGTSSPKILGLAGPLHSAGCSLQQLSAMLNTLERNILCKAETASDIVTVLRYCSKPHEYIVQCKPYNKDELTFLLEDIISTRKVFLQDHRYDPTEIYNTEEFLEELKDIPDPKKEPLEFLDIVMTVLHEMGPWAADRVAVNLFQTIERRKIKTPHERHFLLLSMVNTALLEIHAVCEATFRKIPQHKKLVERYSSPKVLRLLEVLRLFKPIDFVTDNEQIKKINTELDEMDFQRLSRAIEQSCQNVENITRQQLESRSIVDNLDSIIKITDTTDALSKTLSKTLKITTNKRGERHQHNSHHRRQSAVQGRSRRRPFTRRHMRDRDDSSDTLCAIIFCNMNHTARVLFDLLAEMSRHDPDLKFLRCQFTTDRVADPVTEPKEAEAEHRCQEDVLKRFRIHDCNVLIGTSVLEEGIDVPKCNLVVRWDPPTTYRSYVQCKGRARATPAYHVILVAPEFDISSYEPHNKSEQLCNESHLLTCKLSDNEYEDLEISDSSDVESKSKPNQYIFDAPHGTVKILNPEVLTNKPPTTSDIHLKEIKDDNCTVEELTADHEEDKELKNANCTVEELSADQEEDKELKNENCTAEELTADLAENKELNDKNCAVKELTDDLKKDKELKNANCTVEELTADLAEDKELEDKNCIVEELTADLEKDKELKNENCTVEELTTGIAEDKVLNEENCTVEELSADLEEDTKTEDEYCIVEEITTDTEEDKQMKDENYTVEELSADLEEDKKTEDEYCIVEELTTDIDEDKDFKDENCIVEELTTDTEEDKKIKGQNCTVEELTINLAEDKELKGENCIIEELTTDQEEDKEMNGQNCTVEKLTADIVEVKELKDENCTVEERTTDIKQDKELKDENCTVEELTADIKEDKELKDENCIIQELTTDQEEDKQMNGQYCTVEKLTADIVENKELKDENCTVEERTVDLKLKTITNGLYYEMKNDISETKENSKSNSDDEDKRDLKIIDADEKVKIKKKKRFQCTLVEKGVQLVPLVEFQTYDSELLNMHAATVRIVDQLAQYREIEKMLLQKCANFEPAEEEHNVADKFVNCISPYKPQPDLLTGASVDLCNAIALVNKYCSKLPSDTFTKLTALWRCTEIIRCGVKMYQYTLRLPINSPLKYDIVGLPMPTNILARRLTALQTCIELHKSGELDNNLTPIGKEGFKAIEPDWENFELEAQDEKIVKENSEPRPGTTKRRQYYYKRIATEFCNCRPTANAPCYLYLLDLTLQCPIPEEQNTRGRKIYPPEEALQGFGILTLKKIPKVSSFPIFTRSGEVKVSIELFPEPIVLTTEQVNCINIFVNYTFTNVLRLQKFLMLFDPDSTENCIFIVPTIKKNTGKVIDWDFLQLIEKNADMMPTEIPDEERKIMDFNGNKFKDAVVMPWYRNQDQPQYFYVAEICPQLSPLSCFPGENYRTFKHYYFLKYGLTIQNVTQPLLDVDHTSARLNFLTPRYVNRKGVALPTSSEETKRAKRENLEQKQILVPELCTVHPFPASLWRTAVCLPCILYRINGLLLADDIRRKVSADIGVGQREVCDDAFEWPMLDFGWSLSEVLKKSRENKNGAETTPKENEKNTSITEEIVADDEQSIKTKQEKSANEIVIDAERKLQESNFIEIGTWSNDMAEDISFYKNEDDELKMKCIPSNISFCNEQPRYGSPTFWDYKDKTSDTENPKWKNNFRKSSYTYYESDDSFASSCDMNGTNNYSTDEDDDMNSGALRIAFTSKNEAETIESESDIEKRNKQISIIQATNANELNYQKTKNLQVGYDFVIPKNDVMESQIERSITKFIKSTKHLVEDINNSGMMVPYNNKTNFPRKSGYTKTANHLYVLIECIQKLLPYVDKEVLDKLLATGIKSLKVEDLMEFNLSYVKLHPNELFTIIGAGDIFDNFNDKANIVITHKDREIIKQIHLNFDKKVNMKPLETAKVPERIASNIKPMHFSFDYQPDLQGHPGPSPSIILQALTMSNANDGINLERLETIGDSFLKYAITTYLYITYDNVHEGKLSHLRSKQVANLNLYRLGRRKNLGEYMIATKFEPHDNWLPPCYYVPKELEKALIEAKIPPHHWKLVDLPNIKKLSSTEICKLVRDKAEELGLYDDDSSSEVGANTVLENPEGTDFSCFIPYNLVTQHSIPDKSVADCVEALIGAYLIECGSRGALLFMAWLGVRVLPYVLKPFNADEPRVPGSTKPDNENMIKIYGEWDPPKSPLLHYTPNAAEELESMLQGFDEFENILGYKFRDRSYLLQAMTHASYSPNRLTDCYQRLEFLGDAVLDYLITRHLYEDPRQHSPGALTDLRSALVNNTIFASLAVRHGFHKYFRHLSPGLNDVIDRFVRIQSENGHSISEEYYLLSEEECDDAEDVEVPKALGDVFESIAGAIFLDSNMCLDVVWQVYSNMMKPEIEQFSNSVPKSPIRELLELEPETAKFGKPEKLADGRRVRVTVEVFCKGVFRGIGRNYRIAKCTAAKCALRQLKKQGLLTKKD